jgi:hypothetical protein
MPERDDRPEIHDITILRIAEEVVVHLQARNIEDALAALERGVAGCESHPSFAKLAASECKSVSRLLEMFAHLVSSGGDAAQRAQALLDRMHVLHRASLN